MDNTKLVNKYYLKLLACGIFHNNGINILKRKEEIKMRLEKIIEANNDYLLTDSLLSFIAYMGWYDTINIYLDSFYDFNPKNQYNLYETLFEYYQKLSYTIYNDDGECYYFNANNQTIALARKGARLIGELKDGIMLSKLTDFEKLCIENIAFTTMAYCHAKKNLKLYDKLFDNIINNYEVLIDDIVVNGLDEILPLFNKTLTNRVINYIENDSNKIMIK